MADFTQGNILRHIISFSVPLLAGNLFQQFYSITDSIIVGNLLGYAALGSIGAAAPVVKLSIALGIGITMGVSVLVSQYYGARQPEKARETVMTSYIFFFIFSLVIAVAGFILTPSILNAMKTPPDLIIEAGKYLRVIFAGTFMMIGYNVANAVFRGVGDSKTPLCLLIISCLLNVGLDFLFILVFRTGVDGTAWATIISQGTAFIFSCIIFSRKFPELKVQWKKPAVNGDILRKCLAIGLPSGLKGSLYWGGYVLITSAVNSFGTAAIAAFGSAARLDSLVQAPLGSLGNGLASFVGQNVGANKQERVKTGIGVSVSLGIITSLVITAVVFGFAKPIMGCFSTDAQVISIGAGYLRIVSIFYVVYALQEVIQGLAVGCGDTIILMISTISAMWLVRLPLVYLLSARCGLRGIWFSMPAGWFVAMIFTNAYCISGRWKRRFKAGG